MRNRWKKGDWLVTDEESGMTRYASEVRRDYRGLYVTKRYADTRNPQEFVTPLNDPRPVPIQTGVYNQFTGVSAQPSFIGNTSVPTPIGPASHLTRSV